MCNICQNWARSDVSPYKIKSRTGVPLMTNHHPNCPHYNDSLMDVWVYTDGTTSCYFGSESEADDAMEREASESETDLVVRSEKRKMHREIFENLPEFDGF